MSGTKTGGSGGTRRARAGLRALALALKLIAVVVGLPLSALCLMSLVGLLTDGFWARLLPAAVVATGLPLVLVERLTRDDAPGEGRASEMLALIWLGFPAVFIAAAFPVTQGLLAAETRRLGTDELPQAARLAALVARRPRPAAPRRAAEGEAEPTRAGLLPGPELSASTTGGPGRDAGTSSPEAASDAAPEADAGAPAAAAAEAPALVELSVPDLLVEVDGFLVTLSARRGDRDVSGSGFLLDEQGTLLTCLDLVAGSEAVAVRLGDGTWTSEVDLLAVDRELGLAVLRLSGHGVAPPTADLDEVSDEPCYAVGNPLALDPVVTTAGPETCPAAGDARVRGLAARLVRDSACGPVVTRRGEVVGIALPRRAGDEGPEGCLPVVPVETLRALAEESGPARALGRPGRRAETW